MDVPGIDSDRVSAWLASKLPDLELPIEFSALTGGRSNLSCKFVDQRGAAYVLRRPPLGNALESAHDMVREHRIISAVGKETVPVPQTYGVCEDVSITGAPFYVMRFVDGVVLMEVEQSEKLSLVDRAGVSQHLVKVLTDLHATDIDTIGLGDLARKEGYVARQLKRWTRQWEATKTHEIPEMEEATRLLHERMPEQIGSSIVHGDYRLGNMIVADGKIQAVLDWELCTLGDPLADLGYLLNTWGEPGEHLSDIHILGVGGFWTRDQVCDAYAQVTGKDLTHINYYRGFSSWRMAAIDQGVYKRYAEEATGDVEEMDLEEKKETVLRRATTALEQLTNQR